VKVWVDITGDIGLFIYNYPSSSETSPTAS
jgi:hypothetical protein